MEQAVQSGLGRPYGRRDQTSFAIAGLLITFLGAFVRGGSIPAFALCGVLALLAVIAKTRSVRNWVWPLGVAVLSIAACRVVRWQNDLRVEKQGATIASACETYRREKGAYPQSLNELVPRYLSNLPSGRLMLFSNKWHYHAGERPPTGRPESQRPFLSLGESSIRGVEYWDWDRWFLRTHNH
jgi:hypothetical protein